MVFFPNTLFSGRPHARPCGTQAVSRLAVRLITLSSAALVVALPSAVTGVESSLDYSVFSAGFHQSSNPQISATVGDVFTQGVGEGGPLLGSLAAIPVVNDSGEEPPDDVLEAFFGAEGQRPQIVNIEVPRFADGSPAARKTTVVFSYQSATTVDFQVQFSRDLRVWYLATNLSPLPSDVSGMQLISRTATITENLLGLLPSDPLPPIFIRLRLE